MAVAKVGARRVHLALRGQQLRGPNQLPHRLEMGRSLAAVAPIAGVRHDPPCDGAGGGHWVLHGTGDTVSH